MPQLPPEIIEKTVTVEVPVIHHVSRYETLRYRAQFHVTSKQGNCMNRLMATIVRWMQTSRNPVPNRWDMTKVISMGRHEFKDDDQSLIAERYNRQNRTYWACELTQTDRHFRFREWVTRIGLEETDDDVLFTITTAYVAKPGAFGYARPPEAQIPNVVRTVIEDSTLNVAWNGIVLNADGGLSVDLIGPTDIEPTLKPLIHGENKHPVVICPSTDETCETLAAWLIGLAEVKLIDSETNEWPDDIAEALDYTCPRGTAAANWRPSKTSVVVYMPEAIYPPYFVTLSKDFRDVVSMLEEGLVRLNPPMSGRVHDLRSLKAKMDEDRRHDLADALAKAHENAPDATVAHVEIDEDGYALAEAFQHDAETAQARVDELETLNHQLTVKLTALQMSVPQTTNVTCDQALISELIEKPMDSLTDALMLTEALWPNRVRVHKDAYKSAESFETFSNDDLSVILSCATALWPVYFDMESTNIEHDYYTRSTFELALHESPTTRKQERMMKLRDHEIDGEIVRCEAHIKGKSREFLRVYVWPDRKNQLIHIVHAGKHLETAGSQRVNKKM